jgi:hypothetical protein
MCIPLCCCGVCTVVFAMLLEASRILSQRAAASMHPRSRPLVWALGPGATGSCGTTTLAKTKSFKMCGTLQ